MPAPMRSGSPGTGRTRSRRYWGGGDGTRWCTGMIWCWGRVGSAGRTNIGYRIDPDGRGLPCPTRKGTALTDDAERYHPGEGDTRVADDQGHDGGSGDEPA